MMNAIVKILVTFSAIGATLAFAPLPMTQQIAATGRIFSMYSTTSALEEVDAFNSYSIDNPLQQLAYRDTVIGTGDVIEKGKVAIVAYEGRLMSNGYKFDFGTGYAFRFGEGRVIPGWEVGLAVSFSIAIPRMTLRVSFFPNPYIFHGCRSMFVYFL
jgi:FKBP-type peptidyl-prolyl cis-trans isomerase